MWLLLGNIFSWNPALAWGHPVRHQGVYIWNPALARGQPVRHQSVKFIQQFELTERILYFMRCLRMRICCYSFSSTSMSSMGPTALAGCNGILKV